jgi:hypothetical protein
MDEMMKALQAAQGALASCRHLIRKYIPAHDWVPHIDKDIELIKAVLAAPPPSTQKVRDDVIEECARVLDAAAQDWNRIRDPGMANNARSYAKRIRALSTNPGEQE